jgi:spermidine/putrescine transport system permease protein
LFIARSRRWKNVYLNLVLLPFWTSFLVRTYAWMFLLRDTGLINTVLLSLRIIHQPMPLLYNNGAVVLGLVYAELPLMVLPLYAMYAELPLMVLPLYATLEKLDRSLLEAAADLGAKPWATLTRVVVPLAAPGIVAGGVLVFITCLGAFLTPDLLGGGKSIMIGNVVQNQFTTARDWPFGAALSLALMGLVLLLLLAAVRRKGDALL